MLLTATPVNETMATCPAVAIWLLPASQLGRDAGTLSTQLQPFPPRSTVCDLIPAADFRRKVGQPEGEPFAPLIAVAQVPPERVAVPSFVPKQHIATLPGYTKPGNLCEPSAGRKRGIELRPEAGQKDRSGRSMRATLPAPPPFPCTPHTETKGWRATAVKPFQPLPSEVLPIVVRVQPGIFAANPPKQLLAGDICVNRGSPWRD
jgi:hypothetical protein